MAARPEPAARTSHGWLGSEILHPPVHDRRFWLVQAGILAWAVVHDVILVALHVDELAGIPSPVSSALLLVPVMYAALNFGVRGGIGSALWATALVIPHWFLSHEFSVAHVAIEVGYLIALNAVALVVGQRVEREQRARQHAEGALGAARDAEARYRALFEDQPAPVVITDEAGLVLEMNAAAEELLGPPSATGEVAGLLGLDLPALLHGERSPLTFSTPDASTVRFLATAHELSDGEGPVMVQIVLADITEQHRRQEEQREFAARLLAVQEDERARLARELHDEPLQHLTYLARTLDDLGDRSPSSGRLSGRLAHTAAVATDAAGSLRKIIQGLRPPVLDDFGLVSALRQLTEETRSRSTTTVTFEVSGPPARVDPDVELAAYRLAQEALSNVVRHAHADRATVSLAFAPAHVRLTIEDDGVGIGPLSQRPGPSGGLGLIGMRERVSMTGGRLDISSRDPHGTRVHIVMPLRAAPGEDRGARPSRPSPRPPWAGSQLSGIRPSRR